MLYRLRSTFYWLVCCSASTRPGRVAETHTSSERRRSAFFAVGLVMLNYSTAFRDVNGMFNNVASFINTSTAGGGDVFGQVDDRSIQLLEQQ